jgi:hypothetical protein
MRIQHIHTAIDAVISAARDKGRYLCIFLHGPPGSAKSALAREAARRNRMRFMDLRLSIHEPVDLTGVPMVKDGKTVFCPPGWLPTDGEGVLFLDEHSQAMLSMQNVSGQLIYDRCVGDYTLPPGWIVILASNDAKDKAGTSRTPQQINNRVIHIDVEADYDGWRDWAMDNGIDARLIAFLDHRQELLCKPSPDARAFPTLRTWDFASTIIGEELPRPIQYEMLAGTVGPGPAAELTGFLDVYAGLVSWRDVLANPETAALPEGPANSYALMSVLSRRVTIDTIDALVIYLRRISREMGNLCMTDAGRLSPVLKETKAYTQWAIDNHI